MSTEKAAAALVNSFRLASVTQRLRYHIQAGSNSDTKEFQICCISLAKGIDFAIANDEIPKKVDELPALLKQLCVHRTDVYTRTAVMVLMISIKHACQLGWFSNDVETQELITLADEMKSSFGIPGNNITSPNNTMSEVMEKFYPFVRLGHVLVSLQVDPGYTMLVHDFHISKKMPHSLQEKIMLFVVQTESIDTSACIINPQEVSFLLNGKSVEKRVNINMYTGPQAPSNITALLKYGTNLLQVMGNSNVPYMILIAFGVMVTPPQKPVLKDYLKSGITETTPDSDITEGSSRVSLKCPISRSRIKLPVKGQLCKHLQCFDFWNYANINIRNPSWRCPHCNHPVCYPDLRLDQNMVKILKDAGRNAADVIIHADGTWENDGTEEQPVHDDMIIHDLEDDLLDSGPIVLDLTGDDDDGDEMELFGGGAVMDRKPSFSDNNNKDTSEDDYCSLFNINDVISLDDVMRDHLNTGTGQENSPRDSSSSFAMPNPPQFSQVQASTVTPTGTCLGSQGGNQAHPRVLGPAVQSVTQTSDLLEVDSTGADTSNWQPPRMRGSLAPGSYSAALDHMIIRPTQEQTPQTRPWSSTPPPPPGFTRPSGP